MAVSAPPVISATSSGTSVLGGLFRAEPQYSTPREPHRLTPNIINSFMANSHNGGGFGSGSGGSGNTNTNECRMVDMHGVKVASFLMDGQELICLPQVFDLFLKHLVGGLHTVYTKLKRLDISPVVCTVEQVRILRGLGAIQPGVNRCKLITRKDFETLFTDCTNASSRPGRPPKRSLGVLQENACLLPHAIPGLLSPGLITPTGKTSAAASGAGITAAAMAEAMKLQKMKLMSMNTLQGNGGQNGTELEPDNFNPNTGLDLPFMMMPHPLLPVSLPPASVAMAMSQMNHLNTIANMAAAQIHSPLSRAGASVVKERILESPSPAPSLEESHHLGSQTSSHPSSSVSSPPSQRDHHSEKMEEVPVQIPMTKPPLDKIQLVPGQALPPGFPGPFIFADSLSSVETLLTNIQGLLKVALDNARIKEKQIQQEKKELQMELYREKEIREKLERHLAIELQNRTTMQKRLKKEKKAKRKLQEALEFESKRREQVEQALKQTTTSDSGLRMLKGNMCYGLSQSR
ncbi:dachshund homolog 2 [Heterocephalus glaber]|uniref:Dachshund homolog 2 n=1 Tax=Heterocephalus glaber TaxID=10181 RepID=A0AAX6S3X2_HETGA|nr:dachshund homolog 2 [Heterocephalus glaber]